MTDKQRKDLVYLINHQNYSIAKAAKETDIPYDNAKAINRTYTKEKRIQKINYKERYQTRRDNFAKKKQASHLKTQIGHKDMLSQDAERDQKNDFDQVTESEMSDEDIYVSEGE